jgi:glycosyltransferase involved in cell wall biosynthesis
VAAGAAAGLPKLAANADRFWNRAVVYPRWLKPQRSDFDLFHIVDHSYAHLALTLPAGRSVITCHDLDAFQCLLEPDSDPRPGWFRAMTTRLVRGMRTASHVFFVTHAIREQAIRSGLVSSEHSSVCSNGVDWVTSPRGDAMLKLDQLLGDDHRGPILLSVGSTAPRKRLDILLRTFAKVSAQWPSCRLVRVGGLNADQAEMAHALGIHDRLVQLPMLERPVLHALYHRASLLLQPSDREGFGLPVAEALANGCPVVASDLPALRETGGEPTTFCPIGDVPAWAAAVSHLLATAQHDPAQWQRLKASCRSAGQRFQWESSVAHIAAGYGSVARALIGKAAKLWPLPAPVAEGR